MLPNLPRPKDFIQNAIGTQVKKHTGLATFGIGAGQVEHTAIVGTIVSLGDDSPFFFVETEVPQVLPMGGTQMHKVHQFHGGKRTIDTYGPAPRVLSFSGELFTLLVPRLQVNSVNQPEAGQLLTAIERSQQLDKWRRSGVPIKFHFDKFKYTVVVTEYNGDMHHYNHVSYNITMQIIEDNTDVINAFGRPVVYAAPPIAAESLYDIAKAYITSAREWLGFANTALRVTEALADRLINDPASIVKQGVHLIPGSAEVLALSKSTAQVMKTIQSFQNTLHPVLVLDLENGKPYDTLSNESIARFVIPAVESNIAAVDATTTFVLDEYTALDDAEPEMTAAAATSAMDMRAALGKMLKALEEMKKPTDGIQLYLYNPDLYKLAAQYLGDLEKWEVIAEANGLSDPRPKGSYLIRIPKSQAKTGKPSSATFAMES